MLAARFEGSYYEIGYKHGKLFKNEIANSIKTHCNFNTSDDNLKKMYSLINEKLVGSVSESVEELRGISDGSGVDFSNIIKLNYWEEINAALGEENKSLCTSIGFIHTPDGPIMGKTTDIEMAQRNEFMIQWIYPRKGYKIINLGKVGTLKSEVGMNEKGLCVGSSSTMPTDIQGSQVERMTLVRLALHHCSNVKEAIDFFARYRFYVLGLNILLMDLDGNMVVLEKGIANQRVRISNKKFIFATNFYVNSEMKPYNSKTAWYYENALYRYNLLENIFKKNVKLYDLELMKETLRNHGDKASGICNHDENLNTYYASILLPERLTFYLCDGRPCETEFQEYNLQL